MDDYDRASNNSSDEGDDHVEEPMDVDDNHQEDDDDDHENDNDNDDDDNDDDNEDDDDDEQNSQKQSQDQPTVTRTSATPAASSHRTTPLLPPGMQVRPELVQADNYDIIPTMAAPMATSINTIAITPDLRYWMTGGSDGYIRKYDGPATLNGKTLLTVAQRHPFVDSVTKAGVLMSYWENAEPQAPTARAEDMVLSPVYSLAVHSQALWLLSGLESGGINLQSVRHDEGKRIHCLQGHNNAVSVLQLAADEMSVLSGSWDKKIHSWDLNTGEIARSYIGSTGQISAIEVRPMSGAPLPPEASEPDDPSDTMFTNNAAPISGADNFKDEDVFSHAVNGTAGGFDSNGTLEASGNNAGMDAQGSPAHDSLFGGSPTNGDDLFGDNDGMGGFDGDDDNEFSRAMMQDSAQDPSNGPIGDLDMSGPAFDAAPADQSANAMDELTKTEENNSSDANATAGLDVDAHPLPDLDMGADPDAPLPGSQAWQPEETATAPTEAEPTQTAAAPPSPSMIFAAPAPTHLDETQTSDSVFLSASFDGAIKIWDRRIRDPVARIGTQHGTPPWCMGACWSMDGNWIYAGRRNGTVEEFNIHQAKGGSNGWQRSRQFRFPGGSGPVSCVRPMVNGRHLVCASHDILRLYDLHATKKTKNSPPPFTIVPGPPRAGVISQLYLDKSSRFMLSAAGNRGWEGTNTEVLIGYEISSSNK